MREAAIHQNTRGGRGKGGKVGGGSGDGITGRGVRRVVEVRCVWVLSFSCGVVLLVVKWGQMKEGRERGKSVGVDADGCYRVI